MSAPEAVRVGGLRTIRLVLLVVCVATAFNTGASVSSYLANRDRASENQRSADALCALRGDLERRAAASELFLEKHPDGIAGVPAKAIRDGIRDRRRTIDALAGLSCK